MLPFPQPSVCCFWVAFPSILGSQNRGVSQSLFSLAVWESVRIFIPSDQRKLTRNKGVLVRLILPSPTHNHCHHPPHQLSHNSPLLSFSLLSAGNKVSGIKLRIQNGLYWDFCSFSENNRNSTLMCISSWPEWLEFLSPRVPGKMVVLGMGWELKTLSSGPYWGKEAVDFSRRERPRHSRVSCSLGPLKTLESPLGWSKRRNKLFPGAGSSAMIEKGKLPQRKTPQASLHGNILSPHFHLFLFKSMLE